MSYDMARTRVMRVNGKRRVVAVPPTLGFSISDLNPLTFAQKIQAGADKIQSNIQTATGWLNTGVQRVDAAAVNASNIANRVGAGVQGAAQGGIAAAGTGNATTGLTLAALTSSPVFVIGGALLAFFVFTRHPGRRGW